MSYDRRTTEGQIRAIAESHDATDEERKEAEHIWSLEKRAREGEQAGRRAAALRESFPVAARIVDEHTANVQRRLRKIGVTKAAAEEEERVERGQADQAGFREVLAAAQAEREAANADRYAAFREALTQQKAENDARRFPRATPPAPLAGADDTAPSPRTVARAAHPVTAQTLPALHIHFHLGTARAQTAQARAQTAHVPTSSQVNHAARPAHPAAQQTGDLTFSWRRDPRNPWALELVPPRTAHGRATLRAEVLRVAADARSRSRSAWAQAAQAADAETQRCAAGWAEELEAAAARMESYSRVLIS